MAYAETHAADGGTDIRRFSFHERLRHRGEDPRARPPNGARPSLRNSAGSFSVHRLRQDLADTRAPRGVCWCSTATHGRA